MSEERDYGARASKERQLLNFALFSVPLVLGWLLALLRQALTGQIISLPWKDVRGDKIILVSLYTWKGISHRPHHMTRQFARHYPTVYFQPHFLKDALRFEDVFLYPRLREVEPNVFLLEATFISGENVVKAIHDLNVWLMKQLIDGLFDGHNEEWTLVINDPKRSFITRNTDVPVKIYDILDNYEAFHWATTDYPALEQDMLKTVDLVVAGTHEIFTKKEPHHPKVEFMGCGVETGHFARALGDDVAPAADVANLSHPVMFYMGMVDERIDHGLIKHLAKEFPESSIVLVGPHDGDFSDLAALPQVHLLGLKPYAELPRYLKATDVCLIPFVLNDITRNINPTKLLEYMAAGRPVVSIPIPDVVKFYEGDVLIGGTHEEFAACVREAIGERGKALAKRGPERAKDESWERFNERYFTWIKEIRASKGRG